MQVSTSASRTVRVVILGGADLDAIEQIVRALPARCGLAVVVACTADRDTAGALRAGCALPVGEVRGEAPLEPGRVHVLPRGAGVAVRREPPAICDVPGAPWSLDGLLRAVAEQLGRDAAAVIVGPGADGAAGVEWIKDAGGLAVAVAAPAGAPGDPPRAELAAGIADLALPVPAIAARLAALGAQPPPLPLPLPIEDEPARGPGAAAGALHDILAMLQARWGHDFAAYRRETLLRRIERRMEIRELAELADYRRYLQDHPGELADLRRDLLIQVTRFFRDPEAFEALGQRVIPALFEGKAPDDQVRVWVAGCATGEEAYSLSILLAEHARQLRAPPRIRIFATDVDDEALARARAGAYPDAIRLDVTPDRLARNFVQEDQRLLVHEALRDVMLFSQHDVLRNPPFSRLDLISCRNLLIYLDRDARARVLDAFLFGLRPGGFLFLGPSESADDPARRFDVRDGRHRIYARRSPPPRVPSLEAVTRGLHQLRDRIRSTIAQFEGMRTSGAAAHAGSEELRSATEERLWLAVRAARMAVIGLDAEQRVTWGHAPGAEPADEPSRVLDALAPGQAARLLELARGVAERGQSEHAELELAQGDERRIYDFRIEPTGDGVVAIGFDITPAKLAQATLLEADRRKDEFLATLSHELRHPLTPLRVALDVARLAEDDPDQRARSLAIMERQVVHLTRLVDDLFDLSRIAHGKLELERALLDPVEVVQAAIEAMGPSLRAHAHRLEVRLPGAPVRVLGDLRRLVQAVTNLLSNAAKYTPDGGRIDVELEVDPQRRALAIRVRDTGVGITPDLLPDVFEIFVQGRDEHGVTHQGLGVGLNLVRRIVELHGGTVSASSAGADAGSELVIELPVAPA